MTRSPRDLRRRTATALAAVLVFGLLPAAADAAKPAAPSSSPTAAAAPAATADATDGATDQRGASHRWRGEMGAVTVIDFAATWCVPCRRTLPKLQRLADAHPELQVLVVSVDDTPEQRDRLARDLELTVPVLWDEGHAIAEHYRPRAMPATVVLGADGEEIHRHTGSGDDDWDRFVTLVERRLAQSAAASAR